MDAEGLVTVPILEHASRVSKGISFRIWMNREYLSASLKDKLKYIFKNAFINLNAFFLFWGVFL
jgi:hypothetical protein